MYVYQIKIDEQLNDQPVQDLIIRPLQLPLPLPDRDAQRPSGRAVYQDRGRPLADVGYRDQPFFNMVEIGGIEITF